MMGVDRQRAMPVLGTIGLVLSILGAGFALIGLFDPFGRLIGFGVALVGVSLTAPFARSPGAVVSWWWRAIAIGILIGLAGTALSLAVASLGGVMVGVGCLMVIVGAALGPLRPSGDRRA